MLAIWRVHGVDRRCARPGSAAPSSAASAPAPTAGSRTRSPTRSGRRWARSAAGSAFSPGSFCPHYDGEPERRPTFTRLVRDGELAVRVCGRRRRGARLRGDGAAGGRQPAQRRARLPRHRRRRGAARPAHAVRSVAVIASASGNGKTTLGRELARRLEVPFLSWTPSPRPGLDRGDDEELRRMVEPSSPGRAGSSTEPTAASSAISCSATPTSSSGSISRSVSGFPVSCDAPGAGSADASSLERQPPDAAERVLQPRLTDPLRVSPALPAAPGLSRRARPVPVVRLRSPREVEAWLRSVR